MGRYLLIRVSINKIASRTIVHSYHRSRGPSFSLLSAAHPLFTRGDLLPIMNFSIALKMWSPSFISWSQGLLYGARIGNNRSANTQGPLLPMSFILNCFRVHCRLLLQSEDNLIQPNGGVSDNVTLTHTTGGSLSIHGDRNHHAWMASISPHYTNIGI